MPIFLCMLLGMFLRRKGLMDEKLTDGLNSFVFKVALPVLLFKEMATEDLVQAWDGRYVLFCALATLASVAVIYGVSLLVIKDKPRRGEFIQASYRSAASILGLAFIQNIYGDVSSTAGALMVLGCVPIYNLIAVVVLTVTSSDHSGDRSLGATVREALRGIVTNPLIIGIFLGIAWSLLRIPMPKIFATTVGNVARLATPLGLIAMGAAFCPQKAKEDVPAALGASFLKLVGIAAIFLPLAVELGFRDQQLIAVLVMLASGSAMACYVMARNMGHEGTLTSTIVMMTTGGCSFTLTGWLCICRSLALIA